MSELNAQPEGLRIPEAFLGGLVDSDGLFDPEEEIRDAVWMGIVRGVNDPAQFVDVIRDAVDDGKDHGSELSDEQCGRIAQYLIDARREQQRGFGHVPETPLDRAFDALRRVRIVAEEDFACCGTCGAARIGREQAHELDQWLGYVFFHRLDTEMLIRTGRVYLDYGIFWPAHLSRNKFDAMTGQQREELYKSRAIALMRTVVIPVLEAHGIDVFWNGSFDTRIMLNDVEWYAPLQSHVVPKRSLVS
jgi:hypothetical protein